MPSFIKGRPIEESGKSALAESSGRPLTGTGDYVPGSNAYFGKRATPVRGYRAVLIGGQDPLVVASSIQSVVDEFDQEVDVEEVAADQWVAQGHIFNSGIPGSIIVSIDTGRSTYVDAKTTPGTRPLTALNFPDYFADKGLFYETPPDEVLFQAYFSRTDVVPPALDSELPGADYSAYNAEVQQILDDYIGVFVPANPGVFSATTGSLPGLSAIRTFFNL